MKHAIRVFSKAITLLLVGMFYHLTCLAQVGAWERVKLIEPGKNVHVKLHNGETVKGKMESSDTESINVRQGKDKVVRVAKSEVAQVAMVAGWSRGRKAAYGFLIGAGAGTGLFGGTCAGSSNCDVHPAAVATGGAVMVGGIAAGVAALFPQHKEVIYTASSARVGSKVPKQAGQ